jgi:ferredoxin
MAIETVQLVYFSPTKTTERVLDGITEGIAGSVINRIDCTLPDDGTGVTRDTHADITIIGAPVYGGRIPPVAAKRLRAVKGHHRPAAVVVVYGNRDYEDALRELRDLTVDLGFIPIAAAAFIGEHSYHSTSAPIAAGRPDGEDIHKATQFGNGVRRKIGNADTFTQFTPIAVPSRVPPDFKWPAGISPGTIDEQCNLCELCSRACPVGAIVMTDHVATTQNDCIRCSACVKVCPTGARVWQEPLIEQVRTWLSANCQERKEPEIFL